MRALSFALVLAAAFGCKARQEPVATVKDAGGSGAPVTVDDLLNRLDQDARGMESQVVAMNGGIQPDVNGAEASAFALAGEDDPKKQLLDLADRLQRTADDRIIADRTRIQSMVAECQALAELLGGELSDAQRTRVQQTIARVRAVLDTPVAPPPPPTPPAPPPPPTPNANSPLHCKDLGNGSWLPAIVSGPEIGSRAQEGGKGFMQRANCENAVAGKRAGLVCSLAASTYVSPHKVATQERIGSRVGYYETNNCIKAVRDAGTFVCIVDNGDGKGKFAQWPVEGGSAKDWWFDSYEKCMASDKTPDRDLRRECWDSCSTRRELCKIRADLKSDQSERTSATLECLLAFWDCTKLCPQ